MLYQIVSKGHPQRSFFSRHGPLRSARVQRYDGEKSGSLVYWGVMIVLYIYTYSIHIIYVKYVHMNISAFCKTSYDWNPIKQAVEPIPNRFALCKCPRQLVHVDQAADMGMTLSNNSNSQEINYITETKFRSNNVWSDTLSGEIGCLILTVAAWCLSYGYTSETRRVCKEWILRCCLHRYVFFAQSRSMDRAWRLWDMVITWDGLLDVPHDASSLLACFGSGTFWAIRMVLFCNHQVQNSLICEQNQSKNVTSSISGQSTIAANCQIAAGYVSA